MRGIRVFVLGVAACHGSSHHAVDGAVPPLDGTADAAADAIADAAIDAGPMITCARPGFPSLPWPTTRNDPWPVELADLDGNAKPDLVVVDANGQNVSVLLGNGAGTFAAAVTYATGITPHAVAIADLDGDAKPDLVIANTGGNTLTLWHGNGD